MNKPIEIILKTLHVGSCRRVAALELEGKCPAKDFIEELAQSNAPGHNSFIARVDTISEHDKYRNPRTFKYLGDGLYEFKFNKTSMRLYAFYDEIEGLEPQLIIATNGGKKNAKKEQNRDIERAKTLKAKYFAAKEIESTELIIKDQDEE